MDKRCAELSQWACEQVQLRAPGETVSGELDVVSGDASFRRYFRLSAKASAVHPPSWIVVDAPPDKEDNPRFVRIAQGWHAAGVPVPDVLAFDQARGFLLLADFGDTLLLSKLREQPPEAWYALAMQELILLQQVACEHALPDYDEHLLRTEMDLFANWLLQAHLGLVLTRSQQQVLQDACDWLVNDCLAQPQVTVHRDYHSRNLMWREDCLRLGIIDFQDAVRGPVTYDLLSLLRDAYIAWPAEAVQRWVLAFYRQLSERGQVVGLGDAQRFWRQFNSMGIQRHLKVAGIFARLYHRDGKAGYLDDIPQTLRYLRMELHTLRDVPCLAALLALLETTVLPAYLSQPTLPPKARELLA